MTWSPTIEAVKKATAAHFGVPVRAMETRRRDRAATRARMIAMAVAKELTPHSLVRIGRSFGGRDHTTVLNAVRRVESDSREDPGLLVDLEQIAAVVSKGAPDRLRHALQDLADLIAPMIVRALPAPSVERIVERVEVPARLSPALHNAIEAVALASRRLDTDRFGSGAGERLARQKLERAAADLRAILKKHPEFLKKENGHGEGQG